MNCPACGQPGAYMGLTKVECQNSGCRLCPNDRPRDLVESIKGISKKYADLWEGNWEKYHISQSEADLDLMVEVMGLVGAEKAEELFSRSVLAKRAKWQDRADYREATVAAAKKVVQTHADNK